MATGNLPAPWLVGADSLIVCSMGSVGSFYTNIRELGEDGFSHKVRGRTTQEEAGQRWTTEAER
jgi:hypothetical protein